jgi:hypothetical protein
VFMHSLCAFSKILGNFEFPVHKLKQPTTCKKFLQLARLREIESLWILLNVYRIPFLETFISTPQILISEIKFPFYYVQ